MAKGYFHVWPADANANPIGYSPNAKPDPNNEKAVGIYFGVPDQKEQAPKDQLELQVDLEKIDRAIRLLFNSNEKRFRPYYVRLFRLAQLGLEGENASTDIAKSALAALTAELIDDEAGRVKNDHLKTLGGTAAWFAGGFGLAYLIVQCCNPERLFTCLKIDQKWFASFMLLWMGAMLGVWLSYAIRTTTFTLRDLLITDSDRLVPAIRLFYAGCLTMVLGFLFALGIVEIKLGDVSLTEIVKYPMLAFFVGILCGVAELTLPTAVAKRASDFVSSIK